MKKYYVKALIETQLTFMPVDVSFESEFDYEDFEKWLIGYFYCLMQKSNINDRFVKIQKLEISYDYLDGKLTIKNKTSYKG